MTQPVQPQFDIEVPDEIQGGTYSNNVWVWHSPYEFTLDFAVTQQASVDDTGQPHIPCRVVSRIKLPTAVLFNLMQALGDNMTKYENNFGPIHRPGEDDGPVLPPDDLAG